MIRLAWELARVNLLQLLRDRRAMVTLFLMPLMLTSILSFALGDVFGGKSLPVTHVAVVNQDQGPLGTQITDFLKAESTAFTVQTFPSVTAARASITQGNSDVAVVIPSDYSSNVRKNHPTTLDVEAAVSKGTAQTVVSSYLDAYGSQLSMVVNQPQQGGAGAPPRLVQAQFNQGSSGMHAVTSGSYYAIGMMVMFLLTHAINRAGNMVRERQSDRYKRLLASPSSRYSLAGGHLLANFLILLINGAVILICSRYILGIHLGPVVQTAWLLAAYAASIAGVSVLLGSWINSIEVMDGLGGIGANIAAVLGGSIFPIYGFPTFMQVIAKFLPNGKAVTGLVDTVMGISTQALLIPIVYLFVLGIALGLIGGLRYGRTAH